MSGVEFGLLLIGLFIMAILYSSVGHGGASGYLAIMSLTSVATGAELMESAWLKQHAWFLNIIVASLAFYYYRKEGHHDLKLTMPFIIASIPMAFLGGFLLIDGSVYDLLLSITLVLAAWRLYGSMAFDEDIKTTIPTFKQAAPWGVGIGLVSGIVGVGGGIFLSPIVLLKKWATPKTVAATSAIFIWVNSIAGLAGAGISGQLNLDLEILASFAFVVLIGGFIGSFYGSKISSQSTIQKLLVIVILVAASKRILGLLILLI